MKRAKNQLASLQSGVLDDSLLMVLWKNWTPLINFLFVP